MPQNMCSPTGSIKSSKGSYKSWMLNVQQWTDHHGHHHDGQTITNTNILYKVIINYIKMDNLNTDVPHPNSNMKLLCDSFFLEQYGS